MLFVWDWEKCPPQLFDFLRIFCRRRRRSPPAPSPAVYTMVVEGSEMFVPVREHIDLTAHGDIMLSRTLCRRRRLLVRPLPDALAMPGAVGIVVTDLQNTKAAPMQVALESSNNPSVSVVPKEGEMMHSVRVDLVDAVGNVLLSGQFDRSSGLNMIEESFLSLGGNKEGRSE